MEEIKEDINAEFDEYVAMTDDHHKFIYKCMWFDSKRHRTPNTTMYFEDAIDTKWIFYTPDWFNGLVRVEYIMVCPASMIYATAHSNSQLRYKRELEASINTGEEEYVKNH
jgi:hypothetical protein